MAASAAVLLAVPVVAELSLGGLISSESRSGTVVAASGLLPSAGGVKVGAGAVAGGHAVGSAGHAVGLAGNAVGPAGHAVGPVGHAVGPASGGGAPASKATMSGSRDWVLGTVPGASSDARPSRSSAPGARPAVVSGGAASAASASPAAVPPSVAVPPAPAVTCQTDLPLAQSPDAPYNFLCRSGFTPLTWASSDVTMYVGPLNGLQSQAFSLALAEWESAAGFTVTLTADRASAQIVVSGEALGSEASGFTTNGYSTDSYACAATCYYDHAELALSSTSVLTLAGWESTILHELGHVAGLNHVSRLGEVMYPYLAAVPPVKYSPGDLAGLGVLAAGRGR